MMDRERSPLERLGIGLMVLAIPLLFIGIGMEVNDPAYCEIDPDCDGSGTWLIIAAALSFVGGLALVNG